MIIVCFQSIIRKFLKFIKFPLIRTVNFNLHIKVKKSFRHKKLKFFKNSLEDLF